MSLEQALAENTKAYLANTIAVNALTELLKGQPVQGPSLVEPPQVETKPEVKEPATAPTLEETTKTLMDLAKKDRNAAVVILTQFKVKKASEVPEEDRAAFLQAVSEQLQLIQE